MPLSCRQDKYENGLLWYWVDVKYYGKLSAAEEEALKTETTIGDGDVDELRFGLDNDPMMMGSDGELPDDVDDDADVSESDEKQSRAKPKPRRSSKPSNNTVEVVPDEVRP